jgi:protein TonB
MIAGMKLHRLSAGNRIARRRGAVMLALTCAVLLVVGCAGGSRTLPLVSSTVPVYPPQAREQGIEGHVVVRYDVGADGRVNNARVIAASPPDVFDEAAVQAVSRWRFRAPQHNGEPQPVTGLQSRLNFTLKGSNAYENY